MANAFEIRKRLRALAKSRPKGLLTIEGCVIERERNTAGMGPTVVLTPLRDAQTLSSHTEDSRACAS